MSTILGSPNYTSSLDVYAQKCGAPGRYLGQEPPDEWRALRDGAVCSTWAQNREVTLHRIGLLANCDRPWMLASLDRLVGGCSLGGQCGVEFKSREISLGEQLDAGLPYAVQVQSMWQLAVSGLDHLHVPVLANGQSLENHTVFPDKPFIEHLIAIAEPVWSSVVSRTPPFVGD